VRSQRVDLPNPEPHARHQTEEQPLMPHERDETTRPTATSLGTSNELSREVIEQAREDTEHGLKDTDRRGIPSDIVASGNSSTPSTASTSSSSGSGKNNDNGQGTANGKNKRDDKSGGKKRRPPA
jgi:hypothetical protein